MRAVLAMYTQVDRCFPELFTHGVERETYESALNFGRTALLKLGLPERRAARATSLFREHDNVLFKKLAPTYGEEERYITATRESRDTMERLLRAEMDRLDQEDGEDGEDAPRAPADKARV